MIKDFTNFLKQRIKSLIVLVLSIFFIKDIYSNSMATTNKNESFDNVLSAKAHLANREVLLSLDDKCDELKDEVYLLKGWVQLKEDSAVNIKEINFSSHPLLSTFIKYFSSEKMDKAYLNTDEVDIKNFWKKNPLFNSQAENSQDRLYENIYFLISITTLISHLEYYSQYNTKNNIKNHQVDITLIRTKELKSVLIVEVKSKIYLDEKLKFHLEQYKKLYWKNR